jgi:hypothetical protein
MLSRPYGTRLCLADPEIATAYTELACDGAWRIGSTGFTLSVSAIPRPLLADSGQASRMEYGWETMERREISRLRVLTPSASRPTVRGGVLSVMACLQKSRLRRAGDADKSRPTHQAVSIL